MVGALAMTDRDGAMLKAATWYCRHGWAIHPLRPRGKIPTQQQWQRVATKDEATVLRWWQAEPFANIGMVPGNCGMLVIDVDEESMMAWRELVAEMRDAHGVDLEDTVIDETPGGGLHIFYRTNGTPVGTGKILNVLEIKGVGGNIVLPPSVHPQGGTYGWAMGCGPHERAIALVPDCLAQMLPGKRKSKMSLPPGASQIQLSWDEILSPHGWEALRTSADGKTYWRRPGEDKRDGHSATTRYDEHNLLYVFSENAQPFGSEHGYNKLAAYALLNHDGDVPAAMEALNIDPGADGLQGDYAHAAMLARQWTGLYRWATHSDSWMHWAGKAWQQVPEEYVVKEASDLLRGEYLAQLAKTVDKDEINRLARAIRESCTRNKVLAALAFLRGWPKVLTRADEWDTNIWDLNCDNGTLDLRAHELRKHESGDLITKLVPVAYNDGASCPTWDYVQSHIAANDEDLVAFKRRAFGYGITGDTSEQCLFIHYGTGANGKSTELTAIQDTLGRDYAQHMPTETVLTKRQASIPNDVARLKGTRFVTAIEAEAGRRLAEALVKQLTGGDRVTARLLYSEYFEFTPTHKLYLAVNHKPVIRGTDHAMWRRIRLIPYTVTIPDEQQDKHIGDRLAAEREGILAWLVRGCLEWQREGLGMPDAVRRATASYRSEMDVLGEFLDDCCLIGSRLETPVKMLHEAYKAWCEANGDKPVSKRALGMRLLERGMTQGRATGGVRLWTSIGLRTGDELVTQVTQERLSV